jgi:hypothetical protein
MEAAPLPHLRPLSGPKSTPHISSESCSVQNNYPTTTLRYSTQLHCTVQNCTVQDTPPPTDPTYLPPLATRCPQQRGESEANQQCSCVTHTLHYMCDLCAMSHQQWVGTGTVYTHTLRQINICLGAPMQHQGEQRGKERQRARPKPCYQKVWGPQGFAHCCQQGCRWCCSVLLLPLLLVSLLLPLLVSLLLPLLLWCAAPGALAPVCHTRQSPSASSCPPSHHSHTCAHSV